MSRPTKDISGMKFGSLKAICIDGTKDKHGAYLYLCECDCGNSTRARKSQLESGSKQSCGCKTRELIGNKMRKHAPEESAFLRHIASYKRGANKRGVEFSLTDGEFKSIVSLNCFYCGSAPSIAESYINRSNGFAYTINGIDRLNSNIGYVNGNVVPCCQRCNFSKGKLNSASFIEMCEMVTHHCAGKVS